MMINPDLTLEYLKNMRKNTILEHLGIEFTAVGADYIEAKMPIDHRTKQPHDMLHGGASVVLAETLGSIAANSCLDVDKQYCVGLEVNANHIKSVKDGYVYGKTTPLHVGKRTQVWEIKICNEQKQLVCVSRITMAVLDKNK